MFTYFKLWDMGDRLQTFASAEIRVELYKIGLLWTINLYFLVIETFLNNVI